MPDIWFFQAYAVADKGTKNEKRELLYFGPDEEMARLRIRKAVSEGSDFGYINQRFDTIAYLNERACLVPVPTPRLPAQSGRRPHMTPPRADQDDGQARRVDPGSGLHRPVLRLNDDA